MKIHGALWSVATGCAMHLSTITPALAQEGEPASSSDESDDAEPKTAAQLAEDKKRANARELATEASGDYRMGRFEDAYDKFNRAFKLVGVPALGVWSARSLVQMNHLVEASERYREVVKKGAAPGAPDSHEEWVGRARAEREELLPRIPHLKITLQNAEPEDVEVKMDDEVVDSALVGARQRVNPGTRKIVATRGDEVVEQEITLAEGASEETNLLFKPGYQAPPTSEGGTTVIQQGFTPIETTGIVMMAGGGALLITGAVTTVIALGQQEKLRDNCVSGACAPEFHNDVNKFNTMKVVSTATLIGGAVLGGVGAALYFGSGSKKNEAKDEGVALYVRGSTLGVMGSF